MQLRVYASRYVEVTLQTPTRCNDVIHHLKSIFACHRIGKTLVIDNGPQFLGEAFAEFAESFRFHHVGPVAQIPQLNMQHKQLRGSWISQMIRTLLSI